MYVGLLIFRRCHSKKLGVQKQYAIVVQMLFPSVAGIVFLSVLTLIKILQIFRSVGHPRDPKGEGLLLIAKSTSI